MKTVKNTEFLEDPTKTRYKGLHHKPRVTNPKMFAIGGERCPVELFELKRPKALLDNGRLYLTPRSVFTNNGEWYTSNLVGKNEIASNKKLTNHSGRKTLVKKLKQAKVPETSIIHVTRHSSTKGLSSYDPRDQQEFKEMSNALSGKGPLASVVNECSAQSAVKHQSASNVFNNCTITLPKTFTLIKNEENCASTVTLRVLSITIVIF